MMILLYLTSRASSLRVQLFVDVSAQMISFCLRVGYYVRADNVLELVELVPILVGRASHEYVGFGLMIPVSPCGC
jgi:hypothetical protein